MMICIVGKGILGLSAAEFFSRSLANRVTVISSPTHACASAAAAANLATKAQVFARDPHFDLKIRGKTLYKKWLSDLLQERGAPPADGLSQIYVEGWGRDVFADESACVRQWQRIQQSPEEIAARGLPAQLIKRSGHKMLDMAGEAWVNAEYLLALLESVCRNRGVEFIEADVSSRDALRFAVGHTEHLVVAAGAQTPSLLASWGYQPQNGSLLKTRRWSYGGTLEINHSQACLPKDVSLLEVVPASGAIAKLTFSGSSGRLFCSSLSLKCADRGFAERPEDADKASIDAQIQHAFELFQRTFGLNVGDSEHRFRWGLRLGFGHTELVAEIVEQPEALRPILSGHVLVAAGAHKSGFLFAPCLGELLLQKLQLS